MRDVWHDGERQLHRALQVEERMRKRGAVVVRDEMPDQHREFFADQRFVVLSALDPAGQPWAFLRCGPQGFMSSPTPSELVIQAPGLPGDPPDLCLEAGDKISVLGIELETRRRNRMNGTITWHAEDRLTISVDQSFGNCHRYIQLREALPSVPTVSEFSVSDHLGDQDVDSLQATDLFFIASRAPVMGKDRRAGVDVNHRGGAPGFVEVQDSRTLKFPDYEGNKFFNTLGNLLLDPRVSLIVPDFKTGDILTLSGKAEVILDSNALAGSDERSVKIRLHRVRRAKAALPIRYQPVLQVDGACPSEKNKE